MNGSGNPLLGKREVVTPMFIAACKPSSETIPQPSSSPKRSFACSAIIMPQTIITTNKNTTSKAHPQTQLFANDRENEIGVGVGQIQHFLPPIAEAESVDAAAAPARSTPAFVAARHLP